MYNLTFLQNDDISISLKRYTLRCSFRKYCEQSIDTTELFVSNCLLISFASFYIMFLS